MMKIKENNARLCASLVFIFVGVLFLYSGLKHGLVPYVSFMNEHRNDIKTSAQVYNVTEDDDNYISTKISYFVDGQKYEQDIEYTQLSANQKVDEVYVDPDNHEKYYINQYSSDVIMPCTILVVMGLICMLVSGITVTSKLSEMKKKKLKQTGICKRLPIAEIQYGNSTTSVRVGSMVRSQRTQYVVLEDRHEEEDTVYLYKSREVFADFFSEYSIGGTLSVYIDRNNPERYYVDLASYSYSSDENNK